MSIPKNIYVYFDRAPDHPELLGRLSVQIVRGKEFFSFEFDRDWLKDHPF